VADPTIVERLQNRVMGFLLDVLQAPTAPRPVTATATR